MVVWPIILILCGLATRTVKTGDVTDPRNGTTSENVTASKNVTAQKDVVESEDVTVREDVTVGKNVTALKNVTATKDLTISDVAKNDVDTSDVKTGDVNTGDVKTGDANTGDVKTGDANTGDVKTVPAKTSADGGESEERREEIEGDLFRQMVDYEGRPMPAILSVMMMNKSLEEDELQECMSEFKACLEVHKFYPFCAISVKNKKVRKFDTMCEFNYAICKEGPDSWKYAFDDDCDEEKAMEVIKTAATTGITEKKPVNVPITEATDKANDTMPAPPPEFGGQRPGNATTQVNEEQVSTNKSNVEQRILRYYKSLSDDYDDKRR